MPKKSKAIVDGKMVDLSDSDCVEQFFASDIFNIVEMVEKDKGRLPEMQAGVRLELAAPGTR